MIVRDEQSEMMLVNITELAKVIRSKNSGPFKITLDIIFKNRDCYELAKNSGAITPERIMNLYGLHPHELVTFTWYDAGKAVKATLRRRVPSGSPGDTDVYGCQQEAPLLTIDIPIPAYAAEALKSTDR